MICVYVLRSLKDKKRYIGSSNNLDRRLAEHNQGHVISTKNRRPLILIAYQKCSTIREARLLEKRYKSSLGAFNKALENNELISGIGSVR